MGGTCQAHAQCTEKDCDEESLLFSKKCAKHITRCAYFESVDANKKCQNEKHPGHDFCLCHVRRRYGGVSKKKLFMAQLTPHLIDLGLNIIKLDKGEYTPDFYAVGPGSRGIFVELIIIQE